MGTRTIRISRPEVFCKKGVLRNLAKSTGKHLCQSLFFATLLKKRPWHRCLPVNFAKFLRTPFLTEHLRWLLLNDIVIFSGSIANFDRNTKVKINNSIRNGRNGRVRFRKTPGAISGGLLHYMDPTLADGNYDTAILHEPYCINDIINDDSSTKVEKLVLNLEKIVIKLKIYELKSYVYLA